MRRDQTDLFSYQAERTPSWNIEALSVSDLTRFIRGVIEAEDLFQDVWVRGEISNFVKHGSGHTYFSLKDSGALVRCVIWRDSARVRFDMAEGMGVIIRGRVTVYEKQGQYQIVGNEVIPDGVGALYVALEQLKARLSMEGLFDDARKKPLPAFPKRVAIITSPTAAALRDMVTIARRRMPSIDLLVIPTLMQGVDSEASVVESLSIVDSLPGIDAVVVGRGGGSIEDLWTFNSEAVVRAICSCRVPVISAIGHETDFTLCDMAADLRAPTPSAAMELLLPDAEEIAGRLGGAISAMRSSMENILSEKRMYWERLSGAACLKYLERMIQSRWQSLDFTVQQMEHAFKERVSRDGGRLGELSGRLQSLSPLGVLARGYAVVRKSGAGDIVKRVGDVSPGDQTETLVSDGRIISTVMEVKAGLERDGR